MFDLELSHVKWLKPHYVAFDSESLVYATYVKVENENLKRAMYAVSKFDSEYIWYSMKKSKMLGSALLSIDECCQFLRTKSFLNLWFLLGFINSRKIFSIVLQWHLISNRIHDSWFHSKAKSKYDGHDYDKNHQREMKRYSNSFTRLALSQLLQWQLKERQLQNITHRNTTNDEDTYLFQLRADHSRLAIVL